MLARISAGEETEKSKRLDSESFENQADSSLLQMETYGSHRGKFHRHGLAFDRMKKPGAKAKESGNGTQLGLTGKFALSKQDVFSSSSVDQVQRVRQSKGNLALNDELKMKVTELEKLFAEHQLRAPNDQSNAARRTRLVDTPMEQEMACPIQMTTMKLEDEPAGVSDKEKKSSTPLMKTVDNQACEVMPKQNMYSLRFSDDSRGKFYQKYMQKRDVKLREEWNSKRAEKEAKLKVMQDSLEKSRAEMKVKLAGSSDKRTSDYDSLQREEKLRSFSARSAMNKEQPVDLMSDENEDQGEFHGKKLSETYLGDSSSRSAQHKDNLPSKSTASFTPHNSAVKITRSFEKASSAGGKRSLPSDKPLARSVSNFSDSRKENMKPYSAGSKAVHPQSKRVRKKGVNEDLLLTQAEKPRHAHSLKKNIPNPAELSVSHNSDDINGAIFSPSKQGKKDNDAYYNISKDTEPQPSIMEALGNGHNFDDASFETKELTDVAKDKDDFETVVGREFIDMNSKGRILHKSDTSANYEYGNSSALGDLSQAGLASAVDLPTSMSPLFRSMGSIQDSPADSPASWNSHVNSLFSFRHEISDIDASDSSLGSPASWKFHTPTRNDAEAARMRKNWGAAQKPVGGCSSPSLSLKDVTKGFKRFLKFGRKSRATGHTTDWFSVTTSEGDDDTEDGRDLANRSSKGLQKSRLGFSHSHHSDAGFNESDLLNDQVKALQSSTTTPTENFKYKDNHLSRNSPKAPKSFFSLSNFRSKGSESKLKN